MSVKNGKMRFGSLLLAFILILGCIYPAADAAAEMPTEISTTGFGDSYALSATASSQFKSFSMDIYDDVHGTLYLLELGEHNAFCMNYGKHSPNGTTYTKKTSGDYMTSSQEEVIKQGLLYFLWLQNSKESGNKVWGQSTNLVDIDNTSGYYLYLQIWVWAAMKGYNSYECADIMRDTIISWSSDNISWANGYYNWAVQFLDEKLYEKYNVDITVYSSGIPSNQDMFVYDFSSIDIPDTPDEPSSTPSRSRLRLIKTSTDGSRLTDAEFTLYQWNGTSYVEKEKLIHQGNGVYESGIILQCTTINQGKWKVQETKAPANHVIGSSGIEFNIADELVKVWYESFLSKTPTTTQINTLANKLKSGKSEYAVMREFAVSSAVNAKSNTDYTRTLYELILQREPTSDNLSYWNTKLTEGSYTRGTMFDYFWKHADHDEGVLAWKVPRVVLEYYVENLKMGCIKLKKTSSNMAITDGNSYYSLEGAVYGIYSDSSCNTEVDMITTDSGGVAYSKGLAPGTYYVKELTPSSGYDEDKTVHKAIVSSSGTSASTVVEITSSEPPKTGEIKLIKKAAQDTDLSLKGAVYGVYKNSACTTLATKITTNENGEGSVSGLALGYYYVKEITAPDGFELDTNVYSVSCSSSNTAAIVGSVETIIDDDPEGYAYIIKSGANANTKKYPEHYSMAGAVYGIYHSQTEANSDTNRLGTMITEENGISNAVKLPLGTYYVKEISAPKGFKLDTSTHKVLIAVKGRTYPVYSTDTAIQPRMRLTKTSTNTQTLTNSNYSLEGAEFGIYTSWDAAESKGTPDWIIITDADGKASINIPGGSGSSNITYYVRELVAPRGYKLDETIHLVYVNQTSGGSLIVKDEPVEEVIKAVSINIFKVGANNLPLAGSRFLIELLDEHNDEWVNPYSLSTDPKITVLSNELTTDSDGKISFEKLEPGTYRITETAAPEGYSLLAEPAIIQLPVRIPTTDSPGGADFSQEGYDYFLTYDLKIQEGPLIKMPFTGGDGFFYPVAGGNILTFTGAILIHRRRRNR